MKTAFVISGYNMGQSAADPKYKELRDAIAAKGYRVLGAPITWNRKTISEYLKLFLDFYEKNKSDGNVIIGGSHGAIVAFLAAPISKPDKVLACSLSAYFKEDLHKHSQKYMLQRFGKRRTSDYYRLSADDTAKKINKTDVKLVLLRGEHEVGGRYDLLTERTEQTAKAVKDSKYVVVPGAPHVFRDPAYIKGIVKEL